MPQHQHTGHVDGHINGLARVGPKRWVLLGSDSCHDTRLLDGTCCISRFEHIDGDGLLKSVHADDEATAKHTGLLRKMRELSLGELEIVLAHHHSWVAVERMVISSYLGSLEIVIARLPRRKSCQGALR